MRQSHSAKEWAILNFLAILMCLYVYQCNAFAYHNTLLNYYRWLYLLPGGVCAPSGYVLSNDSDGYEPTKY